MYCVACGNQLESSHRFCNKCGHKVEPVQPTESTPAPAPAPAPEATPAVAKEVPAVAEVASATQQVVTEEVPKPQEKISSTPYRYFRRNSEVVALLCVATFGLYNLVWFYRQWKAYKQQKDGDILPFFRCIFPLIHIKQLFGMVEKDAKETNVYVGKSASSLEVTYSIFFIIAIIASFAFPEKIIWNYVALMIEAVLGITLMTVQKTMNQINSVRIGEGDLRDSYSFPEILLIILGILVTIGLFLPAA